MSGRSRACCGTFTCSWRCGGGPTWPPSPPPRACGCRWGAAGTLPGRRGRGGGSCGAEFLYRRMLPSPLTATHAPILPVCAPCIAGRDLPALTARGAALRAPARQPAGFRGPGCPVPIRQVRAAVWREWQAHRKSSRCVTLSALAPPAALSREAVLRPTACPTSLLPALPLSLHAGACGDSSTLASASCTPKSGPGIGWTFCPAWQPPRKPG